VNPIYKYSKKKLQPPYQLCSMCLIEHGFYQWKQDNFIWNREAVCTERM
jgi:hypothetical protein